MYKEWTSFNGNGFDCHSCHSNDNHHFGVCHGWFYFTQKPNINLDEKNGFG